jgi:hypothetical protein
VSTDEPAIETVEAKLIDDYIAICELIDEKEDDLKKRKKRSYI